MSNNVISCLYCRKELYEEPSETVIDQVALNAINGCLMDHYRMCPRNPLVASIRGLRSFANHAMTLVDLEKMPKLQQDELRAMASFLEIDQASDDLSSIRYGHDIIRVSRAEDHAFRAEVSSDSSESLSAVSLAIAMIVKSIYGDSPMGSEISKVFDNLTFCVAHMCGLSVFEITTGPVDGSLTEVLRGKIVSISHNYLGEEIAFVEFEVDGFVRGYPFHASKLHEIGVSLGSDVDLEVYNLDTNNRRSVKYRIKPCEVKS